LTITACAGDQDAEPTIPSVDFSPRLVLVATADGLQVEAGERSEDVSVDPPEVPVGSVVEVRNADTENHRITAGTTIDTGVLEPGDTTTLVMTTEGDLDVREVVSGDALMITVTARTDGR
jgi:hypothetical protein